LRADDDRVPTDDELSIVFFVLYEIERRERKSD
jgi:hypothetical protein